MTQVTLVILAVAGALFMYRTLRGPSLSGRIVGIDGMILVGLAIVSVDAMSRQDATFVPIVVVLTLVGFVGTSATARFIERRELDADDTSVPAAAPTSTPEGEGPK